MMELLQPQIIKFNNNASLSELVRNKYFVYYTISGLFDENNSIHAIYVNLNSVDKLHMFISNIAKYDITLLFTGDNEFVLGKDYFINESLYMHLVESNQLQMEHQVMPIANEMENPDLDFDAEMNVGGETRPGIPDEDFDSAMNVVPEEKPLDMPEDDFDSIMNVTPIYYLPNYMTSNGFNTEFFDYVENYEVLFNYFKKKNEYKDLTFDEEYLKAFYVNLAKLILELTVYTPTENIDFIYKQVLEYFANYQSDDVYLGMSLIFNTLYGTANNKPNCGCQTNPTMDAICTTSCNDYYKNAMIEYIKQMFGDYTFYSKWFFITDTETGVTQVNQMMIDKIRLFITEFLSLDINIGFVSERNNCMCPTIDMTSDKCNRGILNNFLSILYFVEQNDIEENSNRIKVYGEEFGKIYPKLIF